MGRAITRLLVMRGLFVSHLLLLDLFPVLVSVHARLCNIIHQYRRLPLVFCISFCHKVLKPFFSAFVSG